MTRARDKASAIVASFASTGIDDNADLQLLLLIRQRMLRLLLTLTLVTAIKRSLVLGLTCRFITMVAIVIFLTKVLMT